MSWFQKYFPSLCSRFHRNPNAAAQPSPQKKQPQKAPNPKAQSDTQLGTPKKRAPLTAAQLDY